MADIKEYTDKIKSAVYGEEVRGSIVNAIETMNNQNNGLIKEVADKAKELMPHEYSGLVKAMDGTVEGVADALNVVVPDILWEMGGYNESTGEKAKNDYTIRTDKIPVSPKTSIVFTGVKAGRAIYAYFYDRVKYIKRSGANYEIPENAVYVAFSYGFAVSSGTTVDDYGFDKLVSDFSISSKTLFEKKIEETKNEVESVIYSHTLPVFETAKGYLRRGYHPDSRFIYSEGIGLYQPETSNEDGLDCISCSQFCNATMSGTAFEYSRYVKSKNTPAEWGLMSGMYGTTMTLYGDYMTADEMGRFFTERGTIKTLSPVSPQAKVGDLLLFSNGTTFYHCAICTGVDAENAYFMHASDKGSMFPNGLPREWDKLESGVYIRSLAWDSDYKPTHYVSMNDIVTSLIPVKVNKVLEDHAAKAEAYTGKSKFIKTIEIDADMNIYTIKIKDSGNGNSIYYAEINYLYDGVAKQETIYFIKHQNTFKSIFYAQLPIKSINIRAANGTYYEYESLEMYDNAIEF